MCFSENPNFTTFDIPTYAQHLEAEAKINERGIFSWKNGISGTLSWHFVTVPPLSLILNQSDIFSTKQIRFIWVWIMIWNLDISSSFSVHQCIKLGDFIPPTNKLETPQRILCCHGAQGAQQFKGGLFVDFFYVFVTCHL